MNLKVTANTVQRAVLPVSNGFAFISLITAGAVTTCLLVMGLYSVLLALLAFPLVIWLVTQPRWALYQFVFCLFITLSINQDVPLYLVDVSAVIVIVAAIFDLLMGSSLPKKLPRLSFNFLFLIAALFLCGIFGHDPVASVRPIAKISFLLLTFLAIYRLAGKAETVQLVRLFFWLTVLHAVIAVVPFVAARGEVRSFGLALGILDDLAMLALPIGVALGMWSPPGKAAKYLFASAVIVCGLLATQSRASLIFGVAATIVALLLSIKRARQLKRTSFSINNTNTHTDTRPWSITKRSIQLCLAVSVLVVVTLGLLPELRNALWLRFETIMLPYGTFSRRLVLWDTALTAFLNHPWLGVGPGSFRTIYEVLPTLHLQPLHIYVRGLSAHNLFLHYLAEAGVVGAFALVALFVNQFRVIRSVWIRNLTGAQIGATLSLYLVGLLLLATTFLEAGWMWGSSGYIFAFFVALIVRYRQQLAVVTSSRSSSGRLRSDRS